MMLNSHHDTVKPSPAYTRDPLHARRGRRTHLRTWKQRRRRIGGEPARRIPSGRSLIPAVQPSHGCHSRGGGRGANYGMRSLLPHLAEKGLIPSMVIVGEPTGLQAAVAERGLVVLDCIAHGVSGHAARNEGVNAIYRAMADIERLRTYSFPRVSDVLRTDQDLGDTDRGRPTAQRHSRRMPLCGRRAHHRRLLNEETARMLADLIESECTPGLRAYRHPVISPAHPLVAAATDLGATTFVSPTTSDMSLLHGIPSLKIGPGRSERSHTADEYVMRHEITDAIDFYPRLFPTLKTIYKNETLEQGLRARRK